MQVDNAIQGPGDHWRHTLRDKLGRDYALGYLLLVPIIIVVFALLAYPIVTALGITLQHKTVGMQGRFVGLENYRELLFEDIFFWRVGSFGMQFPAPVVEILTALGAGAAG